MVEQVLYYRDIFSNDFLDNFGDKREEVGNLVLPEGALSIDLKEIAKVLGVSIEPTFSDKHSGQYDAEQKKIYINVLESEKRKRFTTAHELGHCVLGHEGVSDRLLDSEQYSGLDSVRERAANQFAAMLLMPKVLLARALERYQAEEQMTDEQLAHSNVEELVSRLSDMLNVSRQTMQYRLMNLGVITSN